MTIVDICHVLWSVCICISVSAFLLSCFIYKKSSEPVIAAPEGDFCRHFDEAWHWVEVLLVRNTPYAGVCVCVCAVIIHPVVLFSWQTPTSQLRTHSPHPCMPPGTNTPHIHTRTHKASTHSYTWPFCFSLVSFSSQRVERWENGQQKGAKRDTRKRNREMRRSGSSWTLLCVSWSF